MDKQKNKFKYVNITLSIGLIALLLFQLVYRIGLKINNPVTKIEWLLNEFTSIFAINKDFDITNIAWITLFWITLLFIICYGIFKNKLTKLVFASTLCLINIVLAGGFSQKYIEEISKIIIQNWKAVLICVFFVLLSILITIIASKYYKAKNDLNNTAESIKEINSIKFKSGEPLNEKNIYINPAHAAKHPFFTKRYQNRIIKAAQQNVVNEKKLKNSQNSPPEEIENTNTNKNLFIFSVIAVVLLLFLIIIDAAFFELGYLKSIFKIIQSILNILCIEIDGIGNSSTALILAFGSIVLLPILFVLFVFSFFFTLSITSYFFNNHQKTEGFIEDIAYLLMLFFFNTIGAVLDFLLIVPEFVGTVFRVLFGHDPSSLYDKTIKKMKQKIENFNWRMK